MAKKNFVEGRTCAVIMEELINSVDKFNASDDDNLRSTLMVDQAALVKDFNDTSMLTKYAEFLKSNDDPSIKGGPVRALVLAKSYNTITVQEKVVDDVVNGQKVRTRVRSIKSGVTAFNVQKFIVWAEDHNKHVTASKDWFLAIANTKTTIQNAWRKFRSSNAESTGISKKKMKESVQALLDAMVFIEANGGSGKNAVIATNTIAGDFFEFSNKISWDKSTGKSISIRKDVLPSNVWDILLLNGLNEAVTGVVANPLYDSKSDDDPEEDTTAATNGKKNTSATADKK